MAANQSVIDELVIKITVDDSQAKTANKKADGAATDAERRLKDIDAKKTRRDMDAIKRNKALADSTKAFAGALRQLAFGVSALVGVGGVGGLIGAVLSFAGMERGLNVTGVATGKTNRELIALTATASRLGVEASAGGEALAALAREQQNFKLGGDVHSLAVLSNIGVQVKPGDDPAHIVANLQKRFQAMNQDQRNSAEAYLVNQGVNPTIIAMAKSSNDVLTEWNKSLVESTTETKAGLAALNDATAAASNALASLANTALTAALPFLKDLAEHLSKGAAWLSGFNDKVMAAGGGLEGFEAALREKAPEVADKLGMVETALKTMGEAVDVAANGLKLFGEAAKSLGEKALDAIAPKGTVLRANIDKGIDAFSKNSGPAGGANAEVGTAIWAWLKKNWPGAVADAERNGPAPVGHVLGWTGGAQLTPPRPADAQPSAGGAAPGSGTKMEQVVDSIVRQNPGWSIAQAVALAENFRSENDTFDPARANGSHVGVGQWDKTRQANFKRTYGHDLSAGTLDEQIHFATHDPYEKGLLEKSFAGRSGVRDYAIGISQNYEAHGNVAEDLRRGERAAKYADRRGVSDNSSRTAQGTAGTTINTGPVTVVANNPQQFANGLTRATGIAQSQFSVVK